MTYEYLFPGCVFLFCCYVAGCHIYRIVQEANE